MGQQSITYMQILNNWKSLFLPLLLQCIVGPKQALQKIVEVYVAKSKSSVHLLTFAWLFYILTCHIQLWVWILKHKNIILL